MFIFKFKLPQNLFCLKIFLISLIIIFWVLNNYSQTKSIGNKPSFLELNDFSSRSYNSNIGESAIDPDEYIIGPGENFFISVSGIEETNYNLFVNSENYLFIPKIGSVNLKGLTLTQARNKISSKLEQVYKNVEIFISLASLKKLKVFLVGDLENPRMVTIPSNTRVFDLLLDTVSFNKASSLRNIQVKSLNGKIQNIDFLTFLRLGDRRNNPLLNDGDIIFINKLDKVVSISGAVKFPGVYEYVEGETVRNLIDLAGGFLFNAKTDSIEIVSFDEKGKYQFSNYFSYEKLESSNTPLNFKDHVIIREIPEFYEDQFVRIEGWVKYPGFYKIKENRSTLTEIIFEAGGFKEDASLIDASLLRVSGEVESDPEFERLKLIQRADMTDDEYDYLKAKSREKKGKVVVDFNELFMKNNLNEDLILKRGDVISIPEAKNYVTLLGQVVNPGKVVYNKNYMIEDYIRLAGGFGWRAIESDVRLIKSNTGEWLDDEDIETIDPGDTIWIPEDPPGPKFWEIFTASLQVLGQVAAVIAATVAVIVATR